MTDWNGNTLYTYDNNSRLDTATYPGQNPVDFGYDWVGNRDDPNGLLFNDSDQLTRWPNQHQYEYDLTGSLHYRYDDANPRQLQKTYSYSPEHLLASVVHNDVPGAPTTQMTWDANGNRIGLTSSTGDAYVFVYDPTASIPAVIAECRPGSGLYPITYVREPNGSLVSRTDWNTFQDHYYYFDELGSTRLITDFGGNVTDRYTYDAWGNVTAHDQYTGSIGDVQPYRYVGELGYYTHYQDPNMDLLQLGVRFYDPETGRFTQKDPAEQGVNLYAYAADAPTTDVDPTGLAVKPDPHYYEKCVNTCMSTTCVTWQPKIGTNIGNWIGAGLGAGLGTFLTSPSVLGGPCTWRVMAIGAGTGATGGAMVGEGIDHLIENGRKKGLCEAYCTASANNHGGIADFQCRNFECWYESTQKKQTSPKSPKPGPPGWFDGPPYMPGDPRQLY